jgi:mono/diheme cytochrome c family protein
MKKSESCGRDFGTKEKSVEIMTKTRRCVGMAAVILFTIAIWDAPLATAQDAAAIYKAKCAVCHGVHGKGDTPAGKKLGAHDLTAPEVRRLPDSDLIQVVEKGKKMPAYEGKLKPEEIKALVAYIRELEKGK